jgi:hypothetical protein
MPSSKSLLMGNLESALSPFDLEMAQYGNVWQPAARLLI